MKNTTIFELSKMLNLSPSTVSRALKNHPDIAPETKKRVLEAAKQMDYEPNLQAVGLRKNNSNEIGIVVPNLSGFFYDAFIAAVEEEAKRHGYSLIIFLSGDSSELELQNIRSCKQRRVAGIMVCLTSSSENETQFQKIQESGMPILFFDKIPSLTEVTTICVDDDASARMSAEQLIAKGKKSILAIFGDERFSITRKRLEAFNEVFRSAGLSDQVNVVYAHSTEAARELLLMQPPNSYDAVFCMSDEILTGVMRGIQSRKLQVPEDIGVIAISNGFFPRLYYPEITFVETSGQKLGRLAFEQMKTMIDGDLTPVSHVVPALLVEGGSL